MRRTLTLAWTCMALLAVLPAAAGARDRNDDGLPDRWERRHGLSLRVDQARRDQDRDGVRNRQEFRMALDPRDPDSDDDGVADSEENAGAVASFAGGVLTIKLIDGSTLSGRVTDQTEIECETAADYEAGEQRREDDDDDGDRDDDDRDDNEQDCDTKALAAGTVVHEAELTVSSDGAVFTEVSLVE